MEVSDEAILRAVDRYSAIRGQGTLANLLAFGRVLKQVGIKVGLSQAIDASRSLEFVDISRRADFHTVLRSNLVSEREEIPLFDRVFDCFWQDHPEESPMESVEMPAASSEDKGGKPGGAGGSLEEVVAQASSQESKLKEEEEPFPVPTYSPYEALSKKDFSEMGIEESRAISRAILLIATKIATQVSRRRKRALKGDEVDPRRTMRKSIKYGGEIIELVSRKRRIKKTRVVLLCDVSGSMDCYSRFLIQFMYGLQNELWGVETFVFSTSLSRITHLIRTKDIASALERISNSVLGWSGGTNIGRSLDTFNREFAPSLVTHRTVAVIFSDGWDRGDVALLEREMRNLKRRCRKIIWLNPLLASENYEPLCKGMQAALPYLDLFLSMHNLNSLMTLGRTLQRLVA
ncbi:MAG: VWA domain-containing protein [Deltaproteobacteria bacterium]|nr:VWA domain-containing protein [Deltaproteobacteria bacterium]